MDPNSPISKLTVAAAAAAVAASLAMAVLWRHLREAEAQNDDNDTDSPRAKVPEGTHSNDGSTGSSNLKERSQQRTLTPTATFRQPSRGGTPPNQTGGAGDGRRRVGPSPTDVAYPLEQKFTQLPSSLHWADPVLGLYLQYSTVDMVLTTHLGQSPTMTLICSVRKAASLETHFGPTKVRIVVEQTAPMDVDRGGFALPSSSNRGTPTPEPHHLDLLGGWEVVGLENSPPRAAGVLPPKPLSLYEYMEVTARSLRQAPDILTVSSLGPNASVSIMPSPQRALDPELLRELQYGVVVYTRVPNSEGGPLHGYMLVTAHPFITGLFVSIHVDSFKAVPKPSVPPPFVMRIARSMALVQPSPTSSYLALCEPKQGTGVRLPLAFGLHRIRPVGEASSEDDDDSDSDDRRDAFAVAMSRAPKGSAVSAAGSSAGSMRRAGAPAASGPGSTTSSVRPKLQSKQRAEPAAPPSRQPAKPSAAKHVASRGPTATTYAVLASDDVVLYATHEAFVPGGASRLGEVTKACVERVNRSLCLWPALGCALDDVPTTPRTPRAPDALSAKRRHIACGTNGDRSWWAFQLRLQIAKALRQRLPNVSDTLGHTVQAEAYCGAAQIRVVGLPHASSASIADVGLRPDSEQSCRLAICCAALPTSGAGTSTFWSLAVVGKRYVPRNTFFAIVDDAMSNITLRNGRGQRPTLHYVGVRHNIRLRLNRDWHVLEPAIADPSLILYRVAASAVHPAFLSEPSPVDNLSPVQTVLGLTPVAVPSRWASKGEALAVPPPSPAVNPPPLPSKSSGRGYVELPHIPLHPLRGHMAVGEPCHPHHGSGWWRHLLPVITLRTTAAPSKRELLSWVHADEAGDTRRYFDLWQEWVFSMVRDCNKSVGAGGRIEPPKVVKSLAMRAVIVAIHSDVMVERIREMSPAAHPAPTPSVGVPRMLGTSSNTSSSDPSSTAQFTAQGATSLMPAAEDSVVNSWNSALNSVRFGSCISEPAPDPASLDAFVAAQSAAAATSAVTVNPARHNSQTVLRLYRGSGSTQSANSGRHGGSTTAPTSVAITTPPRETGAPLSYNAFILPTIDAFAHNAPNLAAALQAHAQAWRWSIAPEEGDSHSSDDEEASLVGTPPPMASIAPAVGVHAAHHARSPSRDGSHKGSAPPTPVIHPTPTVDRPVCSEVRFVVAMLSPLWHQTAVHAHAEHQPVQQPPHLGADAEAADDDDVKNEDCDRHTFVFQTQPLPSACAEAARVSLLQTLRTLDLLIPS